MKAVKILTVLMLTVFGFGLANAQVHHYKKHIVKRRHVIVHRHR